MSDLDRRYAQAEQRTEVRRVATVRRGPVSLVAVCLGVALVVGVTAAVDLRRLQTPEGTALAWAGAAVFGDCTAYRQLSVPAFEGDDRCRALRQRTEAAREDPDDVEVDVVSVRQSGDRASAVVRVVLPERSERRVRLELERDGERWRVRREGPVCEVLACP